MQRHTSTNNRMYFGESTNFAQVAPLYPHKVSEMFSASVLFEFFNVIKTYDVVLRSSFFARISWKLPCFHQKMTRFASEIERVSIRCAPCLRRSTLDLDQIWTNRGKGVGR